MPVLRVRTWLPGDTFYLWVPMKVNFAERPARHFLLAPVDQPVATAALRIWALDPDFARGILKCSGNTTTAQEWNNSQTQNPVIYTGMP